MKKLINTLLAFLFLSTLPTAFADTEIDKSKNQYEEGISIANTEEITEREELKEEGFFKKYWVKIIVISCLIFILAKYVFLPFLFIMLQVTSGNYL